MIKKFIQNLGLDKKEHTVLGVITGYTTMLLTAILGTFIVPLLTDYFTFLNFDDWLIAGGVISIIAYALKEIVHDKIQGKGKMEFLDWWWTSLPIFQIISIIIILK